MCTIKRDEKSFLTSEKGFNMIIMFYDIYTQFCIKINLCRKMKEIGKQEK